MASALRYFLNKQKEELRSQGGRYVEKRATPGERVLGALFPNRGVGFPGGWSQDRLEQVLHMKNWTYVAIHAICKQIAQRLPNMALVSHYDKPRRIEKSFLSEFGNWERRGVEEYSSIVDKSFQDHQNFHQRKTYAGQRFISSGSYFRKALSVVKPHEELEPLPMEHPLRRLMDNPNPLDTHFDLLYESQMFLELTGVTYMWCVPNGWGVPCEMYVLPSHWVWPRTGGRQYVSQDNPHADELIQYYEVRPWGGMGSAGMIRIPPNEIIMERWKSPINKIDGYSPLAAAAQWIDTEESISKSRWSQFQNQARPEFWVALGEGYEDPSDDTIARIEAKFMQKYQGEFNYGKPIISPPGAKVQPLSFSPNEMCYMQSEEQIRDMILSTFNVPPAAVGIVKEMTYGSVLATLASFCSFAINPRLCMRGLTWTKHLATKFQEDGERIRIWWDDCVPHDPQQINADIKLDHDCLAITTNEIRALRGRAPYIDGYGDDPTGTGPGGQVPIPMHSGRDLTDLGKLVPVYGKEEPEQPQEGAGLEQLMGGNQAAAPEGPENAQVPAPNQQDADIAAALGLGGTDASTEQKDTTPGVSQANRKPHEPTDTKVQKSLSNNRIKSYFDEKDQTGLDYFKAPEEKEEPKDEDGMDEDTKMNLIAQILQGVFGPNGIKNKIPTPSSNGKAGVH